NGWTSAARRLRRRAGRAGRDPSHRPRDAAQLPRGGARRRRQRRAALRPPDAGGLGGNVAERARGAHADRPELSLGRRHPPRRARPRAPTPIGRRRAPSGAPPGADRPRRPPPRPGGPAGAADRRAPLDVGRGAAAPVERFVALRGGDRPRRWSAPDDVRGRCERGAAEPVRAPPASAVTYGACRLAARVAALL